MLVQLEGRDGPHVSDWLLNSVTESTCFVVTIHHDEHLFSIHYSTYTYGESSLRHFVHVVVKEARVGDDGVGSELFLAGARSE